MTKEYAIQILREMIPKFARYDREVRQQIAIRMAINSLEERKTMTHEEAVGYLQETGWLQDHDKQIYEQGKRDGIEWISVTERLPEESYDSVIGWDAERNRCVFVQFYNGQFQISGSNETFDITHWMPMLTPPYERSKEDAEKL